ncbi:hypothetical protein D3C71_1557840 [compost metagenome]
MQFRYIHSVFSRRNGEPLRVFEWVEAHHIAPAFEGFAAIGRIEQRDGAASVAARPFWRLGRRNDKVQAGCIRIDEPALKVLDAVAPKSFANPLLRVVVVRRPMVAIPIVL